MRISCRAWHEDLVWGGGLGTLAIWLFRMKSSFSQCRNCDMGVFQETCKWGREPLDNNSALVQLVSMAHMSINSYERVSNFSNLFIHMFKCAFYRYLYIKTHQLGTNYTFGKCFTSSAWCNCIAWTSHDEVTQCLLVPTKYTLVII